MELAAAGAAMGAEDVLARLRGVEAAAKGKANSQVAKNHRRDAQRLVARTGNPFAVELKKLEGVWRQEFEAQFPGVPVARWTGRERGQVGHLLDTLGYSYEAVRAAIVHMIRKWEDPLFESVRQAVGFPTMGVLLKRHARIVPEAAKPEGK
jgi:hypothetical protein